jgi:hypothetical protein
MRIANTVWWLGTSVVKEMHNFLNFESPTAGILSSFMRTDGWKDMKILLVAFLNCFSNASKILSFLHREQCSSIGKANQRVPYEEPIAVHCHNQEKQIRCVPKFKPY